MTDQSNKYNVRVKKKKHQNSVYVTSDEEVINYFEVTTGNIAENTLYRNSSPLKGNNEEIEAIASLALKVGMNCIINLDDVMAQLPQAPSAFRQSRGLPISSP